MSAHAAGACGSGSQQHHCQFGHWQEAPRQACRAAAIQPGPRHSRGEARVSAWCSAGDVQAQQAGQLRMQTLLGAPGTVQRLVAAADLRFLLISTVVVFSATPVASPRQLSQLQLLASCSSTCTRRPWRRRRRVCTRVDSSQPQLRLSRSQWSSTPLSASHHCRPQRMRVLTARCSRLVAHGVSAADAPRSHAPPSARFDPVTTRGAGAARPHERGVKAA